MTARGRDGGIGFPFAEEDDGVRLAVRLTPRAGRNQLDGVVHGQDGRPALHLRPAAPPVDGAANRALISFIAEALDLPKSCVAIRSGERSRLKILRLSGNSPAILARLAECIERSAASRS